MKIDNIKLQADGYVFCESSFYSAQDTISGNLPISFSNGLNRLIGEIDSGAWAASYALSMYESKAKSFVLFDRAIVILNGVAISLSEVNELSCYMDRSYHLFSSKSSVRKLVTQGIKRNKINYSPDEIKELFQIDDERFERPLSNAGNEIFKVMAAIGYCNKKEIFCFPWLSQKRFESYHNNLPFVLQTLERLEKVIILPVGKG